MFSAKIVEDNTKESFRLAKNDIINFGIQLAKVQQAQRQLSEEVGTIKTWTPEFEHDSATQLPVPDFSGIYARTDALQREIETLQQNRAQQAAVEAELRDLRNRYEHLVGVTKNLIKVLEEKLAQKRQTRIVKIIQKQKPRIVKIVQKPRIIRIVKKAKQRFIASKATMRVHDKHCPFSRNVKRKNKLIFKTRLTAFKRGYKACKCLR